MSTENRIKKMHSSALNSGQSTALPLKAGTSEVLNVSAMMCGGDVVCVVRGVRACVVCT